MRGSGRAPVADVVDHGGDLGRAQQQFPNAPEPWLDLSTGINPHPYPFAGLPASAFTRLPEDSQMEALLETAARAYGAPSSKNVVAAPGTQILLPLVARLVPQGRVAILSPTYAEHRRAAALAGHDVTAVASLPELRPSNYAVLVNPNNPDGRIVPKPALMELAGELRGRGGLLVVDEAFMDVGPAAESLAPHAGSKGAVVLRSFGKFFGLAGIRLGFAVGPEDIVATLRAGLGPWAVSGPAIAIGIAGLADTGWQQAMRRQLAEDAAKLDDLLHEVGLQVVGGTSLYCFVRSPEARAIFRALGEAGILVRRFDFDRQALRFGLPGNRTDFCRLRQALMQWRGAGVAEA